MVGHVVGNTAEEDLAEISASSVADNDEVCGLLRGDPEQLDAGRSLAQHRAICNAPLSRGAHHPASSWRRLSATAPLSTVYGSPGLPGR